MKKQQIVKKNQKLQLTKKTIAKLNSKELSLINGGNFFIGDSRDVEAGCTGTTHPRCFIKDPVTN